MSWKDLFALFGGPVVLLKVLTRTKRPVLEAWTELTLADMTPEYLARLNGCNIGVSLGAASRHLISIDLDVEDRWDQMLALNPSFADTLLSHGNRGGNIWLYIDGDYPENCDIKDHDGHKVAEFRATGRQTVIHGIHKSGRYYSNNGRKPLSVRLDQIAWAPDTILPWLAPRPSAKAYDDVHSITREEIIAANPLVEYCKRAGLILTRDGKSLKCLCPLHAEDTPSFSIDPDKNLYHCFGCGGGGSVIDLHMALHGLTVGEAMRELSLNSSKSSPTAERWPDMLPLEEYLEPVLPMKHAHDAGSARRQSKRNRGRDSQSNRFRRSSRSSGHRLGSRVASAPPPAPLQALAGCSQSLGWHDGEPGSRKTPTAAETFKVVDRLKIDEALAFEKAKEAHKKAMGEYTREVKAYRASIERLRRNQLAGTTDEHDDQRLERLKGELDELLASEPVAPTRRRYRLNAFHDRSCPGNLKVDETCLLLDRDELSGLISQWEMEGHQNDRAFYLESWNGMNPTTERASGAGISSSATCACRSSGESSQRSWSNACETRKSA